MLTSIVLVSSVILVSQAVIIPDTSVAGDSFNEGTTCPIAWAGDTGGSATAWKNMAIELMTGSSSAMITLTTVATGQDGTKAGTFTVGLPSVAHLLLSIHSGGHVRHHTDHSFHHCRSRWVFDTCDRDRRARSPVWKWQACPPSSRLRVQLYLQRRVSSCQTERPGKISSHPSIPTSSQPESGAASHSTSSPTSSESSTSAAVPASNPSKRKNLAGPIAGGVVGGLALLSALVLGFLFYRARRRGQANTSPFASDTESAEKTDDAPWPSYPLLQNSALQVEPEPLITALSSGKTRLFVPNRVPPAPLRQGDMPSARDAIQDAGVRALPPVPTSGPIRPPEQNSSAQLAAEVRLLREQMDAMHRQQQMREPDLEPPEYTPNYSDTSG